MRHFIAFALATAAVTAAIALALAKARALVPLGAALAGLNVATLALYGYDKLASMLARKQEAPKLPRVPEVLLLALAGLGGGAGAIAGIFLVRHKTRKPRFVAGVPAIVLLEVGVACVALWLVPAAMDFVMSPG